MRNGTRFYRETTTRSFNFYDNVEKLLLKTTYQTRVDADLECERQNL